MNELEELKENAKFYGKGFMRLFCEVEEIIKKKFEKKYHIVVRTKNEKNISLYFETKKEGRYIEKKLKSLGITGIQNFI